MTNVFVSKEVTATAGGYASSDAGDVAQRAETRDENTTAPFANLLTGFVQAPPAGHVSGAFAATVADGEAATSGLERRLSQGNYLPFWQQLPRLDDGGVALGQEALGGGDGVIAVALPEAPFALANFAPVASMARQFNLGSPPALSASAKGVPPLTDGFSPGSLGQSPAWSSSPTFGDGLDSMVQLTQRHTGEGENFETAMLQRMVDRQLQMSEPGELTAKSATSSAELLTGTLSETKSPAKTESPFTTTTQPARASVTVDAPLHDARWRAEFNQRVAWLVREGVPQAELRINPAHLGPVEIKISLQDDQASVTFVAQNQGVRDVIEAALPRLREMLNQGGMQLADAAVTDQSPNEQHDHAQRQWGGHGGVAETDSMAGEQVVDVRVPIADDGGGVDYYV